MVSPKVDAIPILTFSTHEETQKNLWILFFLPRYSVEKSSGVKKTKTLPNICTSKEDYWPINKCLHQYLTICCLYYTCQY